MMFSSILFSTLFAVAVSGSFTVDKRFSDWAILHNVNIISDAHYISTMNAWYDNDVFLTEFNSDDSNLHTLGHNQFSGMTSSEFSEYVGQPRVKLGHNNVRAGNRVTVGIVNHVDWVKNGGVTPVKNQGQCGSCWSFSTTGALEGAYFAKTGLLSSFSEQQLVDCDRKIHGGSNSGCNGGLMDNALNWIGKNGGLCTEADYPYYSGDTKDWGQCQTTCSPVNNSKVDSVVYVTPADDDQMMRAIMKQPVSVAIQADTREFQLYQSGVFTSKCGTNLDHGVLVVGYGTDEHSDYYLVKNSWGTTWGDQGFIRLARGPSYNNGQGQCGVLMQASYPDLLKM